MHSGGNDYIFFNNFGGEITCPESLAINFSDRHYAIGADGVVLIEKSETADAKVRIFNSDGSDCGLAANPLRCVAKYLFDNRLACEKLTLESACGVKELLVNSFNGKASSVSVNLGQPDVNRGKTIDFRGKTYSVTFVDVGNPHCVIFDDKIEETDIDALGQALIESGEFPKGTYLEIVRVVNRVTIKMRVWERGNGETWSCGTAAAAAAVAAVANGKCVYGEIITVKLKGGDLFVKYYFGGDVELDGTVKQSFEGSIEI